MIVELWTNNIALDLYENTKLKQTLQINDIAELKDRQASHTNSFNIPKTSNNKRAFDILGTASDTSRVPYTKPNCVMKLEGFDFLTSGWLNIQETADDYKIYIYSGIINFFKAIENKTLGDLDLSEIEHTKNTATVVASFGNTAYKYLITDYNGLTHYGANDEIINIDHLVPSVNVKYLWDKIHSTFLFGYEGPTFMTEAFVNLWLTYPKFIAVDEVTELLTAAGERQVRLLSHYEGGSRGAFDGMPSDVLTNGTFFQANNTAKYKITLTATSTFSPSAPPLTSNYYYSVNQENLPFNQRTNKTLVLSEVMQAHTKEVTFYVDLNAGDQLSFFTEVGANHNVYWNLSYQMKIDQVIPGNTAFSDELRGLSITDFVKELLNIFGLTIFPSEFAPRQLKYLSFKERLDSAAIVDWSNKYIERTSERYTLDNYAQQNYFRYQYNDKEETYHDGSLAVNNINLLENTTLFSSKTYSPERTLTEFNLGSLGARFLHVFKLYDKNVREDNGSTKIDYKGLDKRFHFARAEFITSTAQIGSKTLQDQQTVNSFYLANFNGLDWTSILNRQYKELGQIINDSRIHQIAVNLNLIDFIDFDFNTLIYFEQEQQYYLPNKIEIDYDSGKASGEFIRIKKELDEAIIIDPSDPEDTSISIVWGDGPIAVKTSPATTEVLKIASLNYPVDDELIAFEWERFDGTNWTGLGSGVTPYTVSLNPGLQKFRLRALSINGNTFYSNELQFTRLIFNCRNYRAWTYANSGDDITAYYRDCDGNWQWASNYASGGTQEHYIDLYFCAVENTVSINRRSLEDIGPC